MTDILLVQPPIEDFYLTEKRTIPYGLACIASALSKDGFSVEILDGLAASKRRTIAFPKEMHYLKEYYGKRDVSPFALFHSYKHFGYGFQAIGERAGRSGAFLVGVSSLFTAYSPEALKTAEAIKRLHPQCKLVLGGHHPTAMPERVMECEAVDYVIRGEGEVAMPALAKAVKAGGSVERAPGIVFRKPDGSLHISEPVISDSLDGDYKAGLDLLQHAFYKRGRSGSAVVTASRGCPMRCSYCSVGASSYIRYRRRPVDSVLLEIEDAVARYDVGFIDFEDENISFDREWILRLLSGISERFGGCGIELRAMNGLLPTTLDEVVVRAMKNAGFKTLNLSIGSTSARQQRKFKRPDVNAAFDRALLYAEREGLQVVGYIIVGAPGQSPHDSILDLLHLAARRVLGGVSVYYPAPGSEDYQKCMEAGILPEAPSLMRSTAIPISDTTSRVEAVTLLRLGRILNFIKSLIDEDASLPQPSSFPGVDRIGVKERRDMGIALLQWFLRDGAIRGVTPDGEVFEHKASRELSLQFLEGLSKVRIRGTR
jgi:hypothetical protein